MADDALADDATGDDVMLTALRDVLVVAAREQRTLTYDELLRELDADTRSRASEGLARLLRAISVAEDDAGRGLLTALVVRDDGLPGAGWFRLAADRGRDVAGAGDRAAWEREVRTVLAAWRPQ